MPRVVLILVSLVVWGACGVWGRPGAAQELSAAEAMARKAQDPLADVKAVMTDNTIAFGAGADDTAYGFQIQPVYAIPTDLGFTLIPRAVLPVVGAPAGSVLPRLGPEERPDTGTEWGLSDILGQFFVAPAGAGALKWGAGPQVSLRTRTSERVAGPGWGAGFAAVVFGSAGPLAYGALAHQHWGFDGDFSLLTLQPIVYYNLKRPVGSYVGYNNAITYDWKADSGEAWNVPLGLTVGRTIALQGGYGLDVNVGGYGLAVRPTGAPDWQLKFGISLFFP